MTFTYKVANSESVLVVEKGLFILDESQPDSKAPNKIEYNNPLVSYSLIECDLDSLWEGYKNRNPNQLKDLIYKETEAKFLKFFVRQEDATMASVLNMEANYLSILRTALFDVPIHFRETKKSAIDDILAEKQSSQKHEIYEHLENLFHIKKEESADKDNKIAIPIIEQPRFGALESFSEYWKTEVEKTLRQYAIPCMIFIPQYGLMKVTKSRYDLNIKVDLNNETYYPHSFIGIWSQLDNLIINYQTKLVDYQSSKIVCEKMKDLKKNELSNDDKRELKIISSALRKEKDFDINFGDYGVLPEKDRLQVYLKVPKYALRDWISEREHANSRYYVFDESKVAVSVTPDGKWSWPYFLGTAQSPFISNGYGENSFICMGAYDYLGLQNSALPLPDQIAKILSDTKKIVTSGYKSRTNPYRRLSMGFTKTHSDGYIENSYFTATSLEELEKQKISVTNE